MNAEVHTETPSPQMRNGKKKIAASFTASAGLLSLAVALLVGHANAILEVRNVSAPLVAQLPVLERQLNVLREQVELSELQAAVRIGSQEERIHVYSIPKEMDLDRLLATFELLREALTRKNQLGSLSPIEFTEATMKRNGFNAQPLTFELSVTDEGMRTTLQFVRLAGLLTVGDAFSRQELKILLRRTEEENPAGIVSLEQFLATDLLLYGRNARLYETRLLKAFSSDAFRDALRNVIQSSLLRDTKELFSGEFGLALERSNLWPMQLMTIEQVELKRGGAEGWVKLRLKLLVYSR